MLAPGSQPRYILVFEQAIGEWRQEPAPEGVSVLRRIVVSDQFADGVLDSTLVMLQAKPLEADPNNGGRFTLRTNKVAGGAVSLMATLRSRRPSGSTTAWAHRERGQGADGGTASLVADRQAASGEACERLPSSGCLLPWRSPSPASSSPRVEQARLESRRLGA